MSTSAPRRYRNRRTPDPNNRHAPVFGVVFDARAVNPGVSAQFDVTLSADATIKLADISTWSIDDNEITALVQIAPRLLRLTTTLPVTTGMIFAAQPLPAGCYGPNVVGQPSFIWVQ
jgi:hypothetical protein